jgi:hypothetical protein
VRIRDQEIDNLGKRYEGAFDQVSRRRRGEPVFPGNEEMSDYPKGSKGSFGSSYAIE